MQKVQRYSYQRPFVEVYRLSPGDTLWRTNLQEPVNSHPCETLPNRKLLARGVPYPRFAQIRPLAVCGRGTITTREPPHVWRDRSLTDIGPQLGGFPEDELEETLSYELQRFQFNKISSSPDRLSASTDVHLDRDSWQILDFGTNLTGFIGLEVVCREPVTLYLVFDEILLNGDVAFNRLDRVNAVCYNLDPGTVALESFEPYTLRYLKVIAHGGSVDLGNLYLRELANPHGSGDRKLADSLKPRVLELFDYFEKYRNADGALEGLEGWVFVEWSAANKFVQDVNYPTNMLYCAALEAAGKMYNRGDFCEQAAELKKVILDPAFDGDFFVDNSVREDGRLTPTRNRTEVCQYYAFYFGIASTEKQPELWRRLITEFGPLGRQRELYPDLHPANTFIGYYLRLEILSRAGLRKQIVDEIKHLFSPMAEMTGTLWEHKDQRASCNHGFASHVVHVLYRDVLGCSIDADKKALRLSLSGLPVDWCYGVLPVRCGHVAVNWHGADGDVKYAVSGLPKGFDFGTLT